MQYSKVATIVFTIALLVASEPYSPAPSNRTIINLDTGWLFIASDNAGYSGATASEASFSKVCIPHANVILKHAYQSESAFRIVSWYRRHITPAASLNARRFLLEFQAVSIVATVYINGDSVGNHLGAYTPFILDITNKINIGVDNVIAVRVNSKAQSGIPPEGGNLDFMIFGGIVRHVNLIVADPLHVDWVFVSTQNPSQTAPAAPTISAKTRVVNNSASKKSCTVITSVVDRGNNVVATATATQNVPANGAYEFSQMTSAIVNPQLWDVDHPNLYYVYTQVRDGSAFVDEYVTRTGIRSLTMNKTDGQCYLNGKAVKLRGLNRHETYPYIGRAAAKRLQRKDADILKYDLGCNIVRTSHYPQSPDFFDRCDEIGLLVLEEIPGWMYVGNEAWQNLELQVLREMVVRDRNHPCIMTWGVRVNESADDNGFYKKTNDSAHFYDPSRLTCGVRRSNSDPATSFLEDIWTQNFATPSSNPSNMPTITTEWCGHNLDPQSHSWDNDDVQIGQITDGSYGHAKGQNASYSTKIWGGLLGWCAFDYASSHANATTNETGRGINSYISPHGVASVFRLPKLAGYFYQSQRDPVFYGPMVRICNYWTSSSPTSVLVVSNCDQVELFQDGTSLGKKTAGNLYASLPHPCFSWNATFKSGELKAVGYIGGSQAATHIVKTPGSPAGLTVVPDTNVLYEGGDMTRVVVSMIDASGQLIHLNGDSVSLSATGAGDFIGEAKTALEGGQMAFYVKTRASQTGSITCQASAGSLSASATITVVQGSPVPANGPFPAHIPIFFTNKPQFFKVCGNRFTLPRWAQKGIKVQVFDLSGRVLIGASQKNRVLDLTKTGIVDGVRVVKINLDERTIKKRY